MGSKLWTTSFKINDNLIVETGLEIGVDNIDGSTDDNGENTDDNGGNDNGENTDDNGENDNGENTDDSGNGKIIFNKKFSNFY